MCLLTALGRDGSFPISMYSSVSSVETDKDKQVQLMFKGLKSNPLLVTRMLAYKHLFMFRTGMQHFTKLPLIHPCTQTRSHTNGVSDIENWCLVSCEGAGIELATPLVNGQLALPVSLLSFYDYISF